ncbi:hypothetical protein HDV06_000790 [Boothiomyces sp. JEL0866]|nr:hypothetical protein HDV06_000790 [Boothiomyces sp. JEL0866]
MTRGNQHEIDIVIENIDDGENILESNQESKISKREVVNRKSRTITESLKPDVIMNAKTNIYTAQTKAQFFETISNTDFQDDLNFTRALSSMPMQQLSNLKKEPPKSIKTGTQVLLYTPENNSILLEKNSMNAKEVSEKIQHTYDELKKMFENLKHLAEFKITKLRNITIPPFDEELAEFKEVRKLEYLLGVALTDYDMILESETWINEEKLRQHYETQLESIKLKHKKELEDLRKKKINHVKCDKQIVDLSNKNDSLVDELSAMEKENSQLKEQIRQLQIEYSNKQEEFTLLMTKYKHIQIHTKMNLFNNHIGPVKDAEQEFDNQTSVKDIQILSEYLLLIQAARKQTGLEQTIKIEKSVFYDPPDIRTAATPEPSKLVCKKIEKKSTVQKLGDGVKDLLSLIDSLHVDGQVKAKAKEIQSIVNQIHSTPKRHTKEIDKVTLKTFKNHF